MALFSQRKGIRPLHKAIQREAIDDELRNRLWNELTIFIWNRWAPMDKILLHQPEGGRRVEHLVQLIWLYYFKEPIDTIPDFKSGHPKSAYQILREYFLEEQWWKVYDFVEFVLKNSGDDWSRYLRQAINEALESENAAYRVVENEIVEITDQNEIEAIESAIKGSVSPSSAHFQRALELLSDRRQPDYRNSIKESISAVEAICKILSGKSEASLGDGLKELKSKMPLHPALEKALFKLYGYTSDADGIRHALTAEAESPSYSDAKFMLVVCAGFANYLMTKAAECGLKIKQS
ncbi:MAG: hypothetical protein HQK57_05320 [Deltaproteobacteria bacterium]|nr:hypothetical protein [Deltaproteobacteria bacterium]